MRNGCGLVHLEDHKPFLSKTRENACFGHCIKQTNGRFSSDSSPPVGCVNSVWIFGDCMSDLCTTDDARNRSPRASFWLSPRESDLIVKRVPSTELARGEQAADSATNVPLSSLGKKLLPLTAFWFLIFSIYRPPQPHCTLPVYTLLGALYLKYE